MAPPEHAAAPRGKDGCRVPASTAGRQKSVLAHGCHCQTRPCVDVSTCTKHLDCSEDAVRYLRVWKVEEKFWINFLNQNLQWQLLTVVTVLLHRDWERSNEFRFCNSFSLQTFKRKKYLGIYEMLTLLVIYCCAYCRNFPLPCSVLFNSTSNWNATEYHSRPEINILGLLVHSITPVNWQ